MSHIIFMDWTQGVFTSQFLYHSYGYFARFHHRQLCNKLYLTWHTPSCYLCPAAIQCASSPDCFRAGAPAFGLPDRMTCLNSESSLRGHLSRCFETSDCLWKLIACTGLYSWREMQKCVSFYLCVLNCFIQLWVVQS